MDLPCNCCRLPPAHRAAANGTFKTPPPGCAQLVLAGHNWGGVLAWCAAHSAPELFSRLVVVCAPHPSCFLSSVLRLLLDWDQARRSWWVPPSGPGLLRVLLQRSRAPSTQAPPAVYIRPTVDFNSVRSSKVATRPPASPCATATPLPRLCQLFLPHTPCLTAAGT